MGLLVLPQNSLSALACCLVAVVLELLRIVVAYLLCARQSTQVREFAREKIRLKVELSQIKSAQLELVKKSKLERRLIEAEKKMDNLKDDVLPALRQNMRRAFFYIRLVVYGLVSVACFNMDMLVVDSNMFFPFAVFPDRLINMPAWAILVITALATRHTLRTVIPLVSVEVIV